MYTRCAQKVERTKAFYVFFNINVDQVKVMPRTLCRRLITHTHYATRGLPTMQLTIVL